MERKKIVIDGKEIWQAQLQAEDKVEVLNLNEQYEVTGGGGNPSPVTRRMGGDKFVRVDTGEVFECKPRQTIKGIANTKATLRQLKKLLKHNLHKKDYKKMMWYTLTFFDRIKNADEVQRLHTEFINILNNPKHTYFRHNGELLYIMVRELHEDKSGYHIHGILYAPNNTLEGGIWLDDMCEVIWNNGDFLGNNYVYFDELKPNEDFGYILPHPTDSTNKYAQKMNGKFWRLVNEKNGFRYYFSTPHKIKKPPKMFYGDFRERTNGRVESRRKEISIDIGNGKSITQVKEWYDKDEYDDLAF